MMMDPPRGEIPLGMTEDSIFDSIRREPVFATVDQNADRHAREPATDEIMRTPASSREKQSSAAVRLHREGAAPAPRTDPVRQGPIGETVAACKQAYRGAAYDLKHWKRLPANTAAEKAKLVATRGGRLPYLVLTIAIAFLVFFAVIHCVKWLGRRGTEPTIIYTKSDLGRGAIRPSVGPAPKTVPPPPPTSGVLSEI